MIDFDKMTKKQKKEIYDDWLVYWEQHDCHLSPDDGCEFCLRFFELCQKMKVKCPVRFI